MTDEAERDTRDDGPAYTPPRATRLAARARAAGDCATGSGDLDCDPGNSAELCDIAGSSALNCAPGSGPESGGV